MFSGLPTGQTKTTFGTANRSNINKWPGAKFGKISLNCLDVWHFSPPYVRHMSNDTCMRTSGRRTEQAKANLDPTSGPTSGPASGPTSGATSMPTRAPTRVDSPCFQPFKDSPRKLPRNIPRRRPRKCPRKRPLKWSRFTCPVFTCSVPQPTRQKQRCAAFQYLSL